MKTKNLSYKTAAALAVITPILLLWLISAVGVLGAAGDKADLMYIAVLLVEIIGVFIVRFKSRGLAFVMIAAALIQSLIAVIALINEMNIAPHSSIGEILGLNGFFVALFLFSAWLFRKASLNSV